VAHQPFRFGVKLRHCEDLGEWRNRVRRIEALGYHSISTPDHFGPQLAPLIAAMSAASATTRLRVGTSVLGNDFRHPVVLAKEAATLDLLSEGRFELGLGAGWMESDYHAVGQEMLSPGVRIERLAEAISILKRCFAGGRVDFDGRHYRVEGLDAAPRPLQPGGPPLLIGGGGRRLLSLAAREADIVGINPMAAGGIQSASMDLDATAEATSRKVAWVREAAGERIDNIELCMQVFCTEITDQKRKADEALARRFGTIPLEEARGIPSAWTGPLTQIGDALEHHRERWGISYWIVPQDVVEDLAPLVERLTGR
jgi:probable F420-dependent oxidoreductase